MLDCGSRRLALPARLPCNSPLFPCHPLSHPPSRSPNTTEPCHELFCPVYSLGVSPDPLRAAAAAARRRLLQDEGAGVGGTAPEPEVFLAVGLDSGEPQQHPHSQLREWEQRA